MHSYCPAGGRTLLVGALFLIGNRAFGFGNMLIGVLPLDVFLGFTVSFEVGTLFGSVAIG